MTVAVLTCEPSALHKRRLDLEEESSRAGLPFRKESGSRGHTQQVHLTMAQLQQIRHCVHEHESEMSSGLAVAAFISVLRGRRKRIRW